MMSTPPSPTGPSLSWAARIARMAAMSCWVAARIVVSGAPDASGAARFVALGIGVSSPGRAARARSGP